MNKMEIVRIDPIAWVDEKGNVRTVTVVKWLDEKGVYHVDFLEGLLSEEEVLRRLKR